MAKKSKSKYVLLAKVKQPEKFGWGGGISGGLSGAASGASMGSMFGPWGTAIGAVAGGAYGAVTGSKQEDEQAKLLKEQQAQQLLAQQQMQNQSGIVPNYMPDGGMISNKQPVSIPYDILNGPATPIQDKKPMDMVYASPQGKYFKFDTNAKFGQIDENTYKSYPKIQQGDYNQMAVPNISFDSIHANPQVQQPIQKQFAQGGQQIYEQGGESENTAEVEGSGSQSSLNPGETALTPDGQFIKYVGPRHGSSGKTKEIRKDITIVGKSDSGIKTNLPNGSYIFAGKSLKGKGDIKNFAEESLKYDPTKYQKIAEDPKADSLKKKTAELMAKKHINYLQSTLRPKNDQAKEEKEIASQQQFVQDLFAFGGTMMYKDGGIHIKPENKGKFTAAAKRAGKSVQEYASQILAHKENYSSTLVKRAKFARNASKFKHADGGHIELNRLPTYFADGGTKQAFLDRAMQAQTKVAYYVKGGEHGFETQNEDTFGFDQFAKGVRSDIKTPPATTQSEGFNWGKFNPLLPGSEDIMTPQAPGTYSTPSTNWNGFGTSNVKIPGSGKFSTPEMGNTFNPETSGESDGFNWGKLGTEAAIGIAQNFGPASFLAGPDNKADVQAFYNYNPNTLDPTNALRDVDQSTSALRSAIPGTTGGSGNLAINALLANKLQGDQTKSNIRAEYDRANTGIRNQGQQFNIGNRYRTDDLNQANKDKVLSARYKAKYDIGENLARQGSSITRENKANQYDQASLDMIPSMFSYFQEHPEAMKQFKAFITKRR